MTRVVDPCPPAVDHIRHDHHHIDRTLIVIGVSQAGRGGREISVPRVQGAGCIGSVKVKQRRINQRARGSNSAVDQRVPIDHGL